jgi:choline dehydrogenase-like flavoprotein
MLNCAIWLAPMRSETRARGVSSLKKIMRSIGERNVPDDFGTHLMQVITDVDEIFNAAYRKVVRRGPIIVKTWFWSECSPDPDSRVTLTDERDALGLRRIRLDWRIPQAFTRTYVRMHELLGQELGRAGIGRLQMLHAEPGEDPREHVASSAHHMGTTRMHVDPRKGVVDANCRLHGIENLYVAGSSVFPTCGQSAATFTIVALALRLADHLKQRST